MRSATRSWSGTIWNQTASGQMRAWMGESCGLTAYTCIANCMTACGLKTELDRDRIADRACVLGLWDRATTQPRGRPHKCVGAFFRSRSEINDQANLRIWIILIKIWFPFLFVLSYLMYQFWFDFSADFIQSHILLRLQGKFLMKLKKI